MTSKQKPVIEDIMQNVLNEEYKELALDFVKWMRENKMNPKWASANSWKVNYKGKVVCYIRTSGSADYNSLEDGSWHVNFRTLTDQVYNLDVSGEAIKLIWDRVRNCNSCYKCKPGVNLTVNDKGFKSVCHSWLYIRNPVNELLETVKKMIEAVRYSIANFKK
jgi:hypothetical protein